MATTALELATAEGKALGLSAVRLVERTIRQTERLLDRIEAAKLDDLHPSELKTLIDAWRIVIAVGREAFRLDEPQAQQPLMNLALLYSDHSDPGNATVVDEHPEPKARAIEG